MRESRHRRAERWSFRRPVAGTLGAALLLLVAGGPAAAHGAAADPSPRERARQHYEVGAAAFEAGDYASALGDLDESYRLFPSLRTLYSLGLCQHALGSFGPALRSLEQYLREGGADAPPELRARAEELVAQMRAELGRLEIRVNVEGAEVRVDGEVVGRSPLAAPVEVGPGWHVVEARHESWDGPPQRVNVTAGAAVVVTLALAPEPPPEPPPPPVEPEPAPPASSGWGPPAGVPEQEWYGISESHYQQYVYATGRHQPLASWLLERNRENPDLDLGILVASTQGPAWLLAGMLTYFVYEDEWQAKGWDLPWVSFFEWLFGGGMTVAAILMAIVDALDLNTIPVAHPERLAAPPPSAPPPIDVSLGPTGLVLRF
ncbi:MAG: PEGA domain-containing protein [Deltaproteobacteria bacterium]|nr:PEGA domain-containing protein [Deltaproteobacteria bacterium]